MQFSSKQSKPYQASFVLWSLIAFIPSLFILLLDDSAGGDITGIVFAPVIIIGLAAPLAFIFSILYLKSSGSKLALISTVFYAFVMIKMLSWLI